MILYRCRSFKSSDSEALLHKATLDYCRHKGIDEGLTEDGIVLGRGSHGKPFFVKPADVHFSISHSGSEWICAMQASPLGIDLEQLDKAGGKKLDRLAPYDRFIKIAERFYSEEERSYAKTHGIEGFLAIWVRKEAFAKYKGSGLTEVFNRFSVVTDGRLSDRIDGAAFQQIVLEPGIICTSCSAEPEKIESILVLEI